LAVGGVVGDMVAECLASSTSPQPVLALAAALCIVGTVAGHKYRTETDLRTNLMVVGLGDSGSGKDKPRDYGKSALIDAGLPHYLGGEEIASGPGLMGALKIHPCRLFQLDEFGRFLGAVNSRRAPAYKTEIWTNLMKLSTSASGVLLGSEYADQTAKPRVDITQPCCGIYGTTVPGTFWAALEGGALTDGSLARFLIFKTDEDFPDRVRAVKPARTAGHVITGLQAIAAGYAGKAERYKPDVDPTPYTVPQTAEADVLIDRLMVQQTAWLRRKKGTTDTSIIARYAENVMKVALVRAVSDCPANPVITDVTMIWATKLVQHCVATLLQDAKRYVADTQTGADSNKLSNFIRENGTVSSTTLARKFRSIKAKERESLLDDLVTAENVKAEVRNTGGVKPAIFYHWLG
jgi:hypothetical protein